MSNEFTPIQRTIFKADGSIRTELGYTSDMLDKMAALLSKEVDEELIKRIAPKFGYIKEHTCQDIGDRGSFRCSHCLVEWNGAENHDFLHCPSCGAKVVPE